jgi:hypothetical protein
MKNRYKVVYTPWPKLLPAGTIVVTDDGEWFVREDGQRLFPQGQDKAYDDRGKFKLFLDELEPIDEQV